jgi:RNA polymerase sigma-70 factor (ECF subfamily)
MRPFSEVYAEHAPFVWRCVRRLGVREHEVEDAAQDVFVVAHKRWAGFQARASERTWLYEICRRVAADRRRRAHHWREVLTGELPEREVQPGALHALAMRDARRCLDTVLDRLDGPRRETFILFELEELSMREVAELTGVPLQTAYARLYSAWRQLEGVKEATAVGALPFGELAFA